VKEIKTSHGWKGIGRKVIRIMRKNAGKRTTNNYRKMHGVCTRRKVHLPNGRIGI